MIQVFEIPTVPSVPQRQSISLLGVTYGLLLQWNAVLGAWVLDISDGQGDLLVGGLPLVTGLDMLAQYRYLGIGGALVAQTDRDPAAPPGLVNLGVTGHLYFVPYTTAPVTQPALPLAPGPATSAGPGRTIVQPVPPPPPVPPPACVSNVLWVNNTSLQGVDAAGPLTPELDVYGNYYPGAAGWVYNATTGAVNAAFTASELVAGIDSWAGSSVVIYTGAADAQVPLTPIMQGQYLIAYLSATAPLPAVFAKWFAILTPSPDGPPTVIGAVWYANLTGVPYASEPYFHLSNNQTTDDPILVRGGFGIGSFYKTLAVLPSIAQIISGMYTGGANPYYPSYSCRVPYIAWDYLGTANLSLYLYSLFGAGTNGNPGGGFTLPDNVGGTNYYLYFNRSYMDYSISGGIGVDAEVHLVLQPEYPSGCMVRIALGVLDFNALVTSSTGSSLGPTAMYTVDNADWVDDPGAVPQVPFTDEFTYISSGGAGGGDGYQMQPSGVIKLPDGHYAIIWIMEGIDDAYTNFRNSQEWMTVRVFDYDPTTQVATQTTKISCIAWTSAHVDLGVTLKTADYNTLVRVVGSEIILAGAAGADSTYSTVWSTDFASGVTL